MTRRSGTHCASAAGSNGPRSPKRGIRCWPNACACARLRAATAMRRKPWRARAGCPTPRSPPIWRAPTRRLPTWRSPIALAAIIDPSTPLLALDGPFIRLEDWARLGEVHALLDDAAKIRRRAQDELDAERVRAHAEGLAAGRREGLAQVAAELLRVQVGTRALLAREHARVADLACAIVARIAPRLETPALVAALVEEAVREIHAEHYLQVHVHPDAVAAVEADVGALREAHPGLEQVV